MPRKKKSPQQETDAFDPDMPTTHVDSVKCETCKHAVEDMEDLCARAADGECDEHFSGWIPREERE